MRDNIIRGTIADPNVRVPLTEAEERAFANRNPYVRLSEIEGVLERLLTRIANAKELTDVNIAAGIAGQELVKR